MNKEPDTYEEIIRKKRCIDLAKYYSLTDDNLEKVYSFLEQNPKGRVIGGKNNIKKQKLTFYVDKTIKK